MVAGAAFAVPSFSLSAKATANLFSFNTNGNTYEILGAPAVAGSPSTSWKASVAGEKAGADVTNDAGTKAEFWVKPVDMLTLSLSSGAYGVSLDLSPITVDVSILGPVYNGAFKHGDSITVTYKDSTVGTAWVTYQDTYKLDTEVATGVNLPGVAFVEVGYKNTFSGITAQTVTDVALFTMPDNKTGAKIDETLTVSGTVAPVTFKVVNTLSATDKVNSVGTTAHFETPVEDVKAYLDLSDDNWLADTLGLTVQAGVKGSYDVLGYDASLKAVVTGDKVAFTVPLVLTASF